MKIIVKNANTILLEQAHGGAGSRKLYIDDKQSPSGRVQGMTHGWLPAGKSFDWHDHTDIEEIMYVLKGSGTVEDRDGSYRYEEGTMCVFPANTEHRIVNDSDDEHEFIFLRLHV